MKEKNKHAKKKMKYKRVVFILNKVTAIYFKRHFLQNYFACD